jgi:DNA/RNA endonuclease G, NUC1
MSSMNTPGPRWPLTGRMLVSLLAGVPVAFFMACDSPSRIAGLGPSGPRMIESLALVPPATGVVISQVYGGGGNSLAKYKNDFIELYNPGTTYVSLVGASVQYTSAGGSSWQVTKLTGRIAPGGYYLVKEAAGAGGTVDLPSPNDVGTISMGAGAGKVALVSSINALTGTGCTAPIPTTIIDFVGYGTGTSGANCFEGRAPAPSLSNTTAAFRLKDGVIQDTDQNGDDFVSGTPNPRFGVDEGTAGPFDHVAITGGPTVNLNQAVTLTAGLQDANGVAITDPSATFTWSSGDDQTVQIAATSGNTATIRGLKLGGPITITVAGTSNGVTRPGTAPITVVNAPANIRLSPGTTPLVIGYQTQIFIDSSSRDGTGARVNASNVTWESSAPTIVSVDAQGLVTAAGEGTASIKVTASDGSTSSINLPTEVPIYSSTARAGHNLEFGTPTDADPSDDIIIERKQYTLSYNTHRGGPNWVSWNLSASHLGTRNRCNCYSADTALVRLGYGQYMLTTLDYTNGGYDRGHMEPSGDQTTTDGENATTFFLTNFLPQKHELNAGPWENLENDLRDSVRAGREAYVIAGGIFSGGVGLGSIKNEGKIQIPDSTWKIVVMMPANTGLANVTSAQDVNVFAVNMPNVVSPLNADWSTYKTTVSKLQKSTGYDFLSALPAAIQCQVEGGVCAHLTGSGLAGGAEGQTLTFDASTSSGQGGTTALSYEWRVNGQVAGTGATLSYAFADNGIYQVSVKVSRADGASDEATAAVTITNVAPAVANLPAATVAEGSIYSASGSFADPGDDHWVATVDYGDGTGAQPLTLTGKSFTLSHAYANNGQYTVTVTVTETDVEAGRGSQTAAVTVTNVPPVVAAFTGATILRGESFAAAGTFADPGADSWTATVNYGDGSATTTLALSGQSFALQHSYATPGVFTVTVTVADGDGGSGTRTAQVTVLSTADGLTTFGSMIAGMASGGVMQDGDAKWLANKVDVAAKELERGNVLPTRNQLEEILGRIDAARSAGRLSSADASTLATYASRLLSSLS